MKNIRLGIVLVLLAGGAALGTMGTPDRRIGLGSVLALWRDVLRDADQAALQATRVSESEEMRLGDQLARSILAAQTEDTALSTYVSEIAERLVPHVERRAMQYHFHVIESPAINAFALPGGHIFVMRGLIDFAHDEAEVAAAIGHEIAHVDLRHCVERYQFELKAKRIGLEEAGAAAGMAQGLIALAFSPQQELDADAAGERLVIDAGYDPAAAARLLTRMSAAQSGASATTPAGEAAAAVSQALQDFFRTHPPGSDRARALAQMTSANRRLLRGRAVYVGVQNLASRTARLRREFGDEFIVLP